jgi:hypothetical protein
MNTWNVRYSLIALACLTLSGCAVNTTTFADLMQSLETPAKPRSDNRLQPAYAPIDPSALTIIQESEPMANVAAEQDIGGEAFTQSLQIAPLVTGASSDTEQYYSAFTHKGLQDYAAQLMMQLQQQIQLMQPHSTIALGAFVDAATQLDSVHPINVLWLEQLLVQGQRLGWQLVDLDVRQHPKIHSDGRVFFRQDSEFTQVDAQFTHILSGTIAMRSNGLMIHARLVERESRQVRSAGSVLVPNFIIDQVLDYLP